MTKARRLFRQTLTIARRDFTATVFTPTFLLFLFAPLIMMSFGLIGGVGASAVAERGDDGRARIVAVAGTADGAALIAADRRLRQVFRRDEAPPPLTVERTGPDTARQARAQFRAGDREVSAAMYGALTAPTILTTLRGERTGAYLAELAEQAARSGTSAPLSAPRFERVKGAPLSALPGNKNPAAFFAVFGLFFLTLLLAGQAVGTLAEEKSNKVIEILAAAVPLEAVFLGKLIGMFGAACLFVAFWGGVAGAVGSLIPAEAAQAFRGGGPAVGLPAFALLFAAYFAMAYMLLGAVFLSVGAQASTVREIQMLSLPITFTQVAMFGLASAGASQPGSWIATAAELFPLSSPYAMAARAANRAELWPHAAALAWQVLWVSVVVTLGARAFRRGVLQSGSGPRRGLFRRRPAVDMSVS